MSFSPRNSETLSSDEDDQDVFSTPRGSVFPTSADQFLLARGNPPGSPTPPTSGPSRLLQSEVTQKENENLRVENVRCSIFHYMATYLPKEFTSSTNPERTKAIR